MYKTFSSISSLSRGERAIEKIRDRDPHNIIKTCESWVLDGAIKRLIEIHDFTVYGNVRS